MQLSDESESESDCFSTAHQHNEAISQACNS